jgi:Lrp/AsnC family leucine-responsive transcriptional regulator
MSATAPKAMSPDATRMLDRIDRQILDALQRDGRLTMGELAERVALSPSPCWRRVQLLERGGFITGYHARLDRRRLGLGVHGFVCVRMENHTPAVADNFERQVVALPEVVACHNLSGVHDYQLELIAADHEAFARLVREKIRSLPGVKDIYTSFTLRELKATGPLPL